jgi:drug/metabolite transporter (DMT)-like permease
MWVALSLLAAFASAGTSLVLKQAVAHGGVVVSTVAFRGVAGLLLLAVAAAAAQPGGPWLQPSPAYWRAAALVLPLEVGGMLCLTLALRAGELSLVQPMMGLITLLVMVGGVVFLREMPTPPAAAGILLVTVGVYWVGLRPGGSALEPLRALAHSRASWYALGAAVFWSCTTLLHKLGISLVGPLPWAVTLTAGSALALATALPVMAWRAGGGGGGDVRLLPQRARPWARSVALAGVLFAAQQVGLMISFKLTQAGYVMAVTSTSILIATALGIILLGERGAARQRVVGALLVSAGVALVALMG